jgi:D-glycero-D-manno-heptose 1,7-bisphosphate phosphatase
MTETFTDTLIAVPRPAVFIDRDGTMTVEGGYINHPSRLRLISGSAEAVRQLNHAGIFAMLVTNQAGVARGYFTEDLLKQVHAKLKRMLAAKDARLDALYYCPHHPREGPPEYRLDCNCRKPRTGMIEQACRDFAVDLSRSYMVGDKISDSEFGHKLGLRTVMVMTGYGRGEHEYQRQDWTDQPDHLARNLREAVKWITADLASRNNLHQTSEAERPKTIVSTP